MFVIAVLILSNLFLVANPSKILVLCPFPARSHSYPFLKVIESLLKKGHQVTSLGYLHQNRSSTNHVHINIINPESAYVSVVDITSFSGSRYQKWFDMIILKKYSELICGKIFSLQPVRQFLKRNNTFDVIVAPSFCSDCFLSFKHKFNAPAVGIMTHSLTYWISEKFQNPQHPAYIPNHCLDHVNQMSFWARTENLLVGLCQSFSYKYFLASIGEKTAKEYLVKICHL